MPWAIGNKEQADRFLGALGTWWYWLEPSHESVRRFDTKRQAQSFVDLLPGRLKKYAVVCECHAQNCSQEPK